MNVLNKYKDPALVQIMLERIHHLQTRPVRFMEVCGGHTHAIQKYGIGNLLPKSVSLISGPGCPVCVTEISFIDKAIAYANNSKNIIATYGDLIRVPGTSSSLEYARTVNQNVVIVQSPLEILDIAEEHPDKKVIFLAIGFETTAPGTALLVQKAKEMNRKNILVLCAHKIMPPAMDYLLSEQVQIDGFIAPGHVTAITGSEMYLPLTEKYNIPIVISGFDPVDILQSIYFLLRQIAENNPGVQNQYKRVVSNTGNQKAIGLMNEVFEKTAVTWRGLGELNDSGLKLRKKYGAFDADHVIPVQTTSIEPTGCICGQILKGLQNPRECTLFATVCDPVNPIGACMVSPEGACQAYYSYTEHEER